MNIAKNKKNMSSGRPPKFKEKSKVVTVTLPVRILGCLNSIHKDRAKAVVRTTEAYCLNNKKLVEIIEIEDGIGIILVKQNEILKQIPWLKMVEVAHMRYLLTVKSGTSIDSIEIALSDLLDASDGLDKNDHQLVFELHKIIRTLRKDNKFNKAEMLFVLK